MNVGFVAAILGVSPTVVGDRQLSASQILRAACASWEA